MTISKEISSLIIWFECLKLKAEEYQNPSIRSYKSAYARAQAKEVEAKGATSKALDTYLAAFDRLIAYQASREGILETFAAEMARQRNESTLLKRPSRI